MSNETEKKNIINMSQAANIIGVHKNTLYSWVKEDWEEKNNITNKKNKKKQNVRFICPPYSRPISRYLFIKEEIENYARNLLKELEGH